MPIRNQATKRAIGSWDKAKTVSPAMKKKLPTGKTFLPPWVSIHLPTLGPNRPDVSRDRVNAQKKVSVEMPIDCDIGTARMAGI